ncbi:MAG TPA: phage tail protein, partial [Streptosporangiaceae bacterium]|nr:phage tail protein [Streptosporangiaceae bacterium]
MTCPPSRPSFRLLDPRVGWDPASAEGLDPLDLPDDPDGAGDRGTLRLAALAGPGEDPAAVAGVFGDRRLARGCGPCEWYVLVTRPAPGLLRLGPCGPRSSLGPNPLAGSEVSHDQGFSPVWGRGRAPFLPDPVAVAARGRLFAVADRLLRQVLVWDGGGDRLIARLVLDRDPVALAIAPWGEVLVAAADDEQVRRFGLHGGARPPAPWQVPGQVVAIVFGRTDAGSCPVILLVRAVDGALTCWLTDREAADAVQISLAAAAELAGPSGVAAVGDRGFCLASVASSTTISTATSETWNNQDDPPVQCCWSWCGKPLTSDDIGAPAPRPLVRQGQLLTQAIDSGIPRCLWHRLRVDADVPPGTSLDIAVATSEAGDEQPPKGTPDDPVWAGFASGVPHADDWEQLPPGATDVLLRRPPGRYLFLRARLTGDGIATPVVHSIRLDFPRVTSLDQLPEVWQDDAAGADFTARFLSLFDASLGELDRVIERYPALLQADAVPGEVLPWLAGLLGLGFDPSWPVARRRALVQAAPELYRLRGTPEGL